MELILQVFYSVFSGALLAAAIPNELYLLGCPFYTLLAFIPYYLVFNKIKNYKQAFLAGFIQAVTTHLISSFWLAYFKDFAALTLGASAFGTGCIGGFFGLFLYLPYASSKNRNKLNELSLYQSFFDSVSFRIFYFSSLYTLYEWVKSSGFLGYPWGTVSSAIYRWPILMQISSITGTYGITFLITTFNALMAELLLCAFRHTQDDTTRFYHIKQCGTLFAVLSALTFCYGYFQYYKNRTPVKTLTTVLVQQNEDPWKQDSDEETILLSQELTKKALRELEIQDKKADLIVWSEGCLKRPFPNAQFYYNRYPKDQPLTQFIKETTVPYLLGGSYIKDYELKQYFNAAHIFDEQGNFRGCYGKNHLVPFAEALPFIEYPKIKKIMQKIVGISAGWTPGDQYVYFDVPCKATKANPLPAVKNIDLQIPYEEQLKNEKKSESVRIAAPICFDDSFTDIMRPLFLNGAELFINITDDSWSLKDSSEYQHFVIASYRSIEYRTTMVRSTNAGYSVVLNPAGQIIHDMPLCEAADSSFEVPVYKREITTYARFGNWLPYTIAVLFIAFAVYSFIIFTPDDYIPSERKVKDKKKKNKKHKK